jgi:hypothetical protein
VKTFTVLSVAALFLWPSLSFSAQRSVRYPPDVEAFITRDARCNEGANDPALACGRIAQDRAALVARYRGQSAIAAALRGHWVKVVKRLP